MGTFFYHLNRMKRESISNVSTHSHKKRSTAKIRLYDSGQKRPSIFLILKYGVIHLQDFLKIDHIDLTYQADNSEVVALRDVNFSVAEGEFISLVGPSGCGKSTLLSIIAGMLKPTAGRVLLSGQEVKGISPNIAYMQQDDNLLEWRSIYKNILLGLEIQKKVTEESRAYVHRLMKTYGLEEFKNHYPSQLSGGMRQRAALIRTLAIRPQILLLDEAFCALDFQTRLQVTDDVRQILTQEKMTTIMVTHDIPESISMSDRVLVLTRRPGRLKKIHEMDFEGENQPLKRRGTPMFSAYFDTIWRELVET